MERSKVDFFLAVNGDKFEPAALPIIKDKLERLSDDQLVMVQSVSFQSPTLILIIAILLGWDRLFLDDIALGILKIITCYGFGIWWLIDLFTATQRTQVYNYNKLMRVIGYY